MACFGEALLPSQFPVTFGLMAALVVLTLVNGLAYQSLVLVWNQTFMDHFYFWNVVTSSFVELRMEKILITLVGVAGMGPAVEASLGKIGMGVFLLVVSLASGLVTSFGIFVAYIVSREEYLLSLEVHGTFGILAALGVAMAQEGSTLSLLGQRFPCLPKRYFPLLLVTASAIGRLVSAGRFGVDFPFVCVGPYAAWVYLRFFAHIVLDGPAGNTDKDFELVMFFPYPLQRLVKPLCDFTYGVFLLLGCFKKRTQEYRNNPMIDGLSGVDPEYVARLPPVEVRDPIAERRRIRAMKLLDEKFAKLNAKPVNRWEDDEGGDMNPPPPLSGGRRDTSAVESQENGPSIAHVPVADDEDWGEEAGLDR